MKINYTEQVTKTIELPEEVVTKVTIAKLRNLVYPGEYLREIKGKTYLMQDDPNWRHGSVSEEKVREATELDIAAMLIISKLFK